MGSIALRAETTDWEQDLCFHHPQVFLIPAEHLSPHGMSPSFARLLRHHRGVSSEWIDLFDRSLSLYFERVTSLADEAPMYWRKPRAPNLCVVRQPDRTRPFYQPLSRSSWLLYESDFDPACSNLEHATYQLVHVERLERVGDPAMTWIHNLSYFMARSPEQRASFARGCEASTRPDAEAFRGLGRLTRLVDSFYHDQLAPGPEDSDLPTARIEPAGLTIPADHQGEFQTLAKSFLGVAHEVMREHYERQGRDGRGGADDRLIEWLRETRPLIMLTDHLGGTLWDPDRPAEVGSLRSVLDGIPERAAKSLEQDWSVIDRYSRAFLGAVANAEELEPPGESLDQEDGVYLHAERTIIAYSLAQPGFKTLAEEAPPYHRMLVAARTIHEWGHIAAEAGMVRVPDHLEDAHEEARLGLLGAFDEIIASAPARHRETAEREVELLRREGYRLGDMPLQRVGDYQANLLARCFLSGAELESYVRTNVRPLIDEPDIGPYLRLARYAYEYQYLLLGLITDPFGYLLSTTWFAEDLIETGIVTEAKARALFDAVTALFACHEIDTSRISLP